MFKFNDFSKMQNFFISQLFKITTEKKPEVYNDIHVGYIFCLEELEKPATMRWVWNDIKKNIETKSDMHNSCKEIFHLFKSLYAGEIGDVPEELKTSLDKIIGRSGFLDISAKLFSQTKNIQSYEWKKYPQNKLQNKNKGMEILFINMKEMEQNAKELVNHLNRECYKSSCSSKEGNFFVIVNLTESLDNFKKIANKEQKNAITLGEKDEKINLVVQEPSTQRIINHDFKFFGSYEPDLIDNPAEVVYQPVPTEPEQGIEGNVLIP